MAKANTPGLTVEYIMVISKMIKEKEEESILGQTEQSMMACSEMAKEMDQVNTSTLMAGFKMVDGKTINL